MEDEEIRQKLVDFYEKKKSTHSINVEDFKVSKNFAAGNGLDIWTMGQHSRQDRALVPVNLLEPVVNSVVFKFTENPFEFKTADENVPLEQIIDTKELKFQLSSALREVCIDGLSYLLVYTKDGQLKMRRLNNFNVVFGDCDYADGEDAKEVCIIDKKKVKEKKQKTDLAVAFDHVLNLGEKEVPVITYYFKCKEEDGTEGVCQCKFEDDELVEKVVLPLKHIPVVRFYGKECPIDNFQKNWRGLYYLVKGLLKNIDLTMSLWQERLFTSETFKYWIAEEALGNNVDQLSKINAFPTVFKTYKSIDQITAQPLPAPQKVDMRAFLEDLSLSYETNKATIYEILGTVAGEEKGNETAEAVLLRREAKDTAVNDLIKNLLDSSWQLCAILEDFTGIKITIQSDLFDKIKKQEDLQKIMALVQYVNQNPLAVPLVPVMVAKLDVDDITKQTMLKTMAQYFDMQGQQNQAVQEMQAQLQQLQMENMQLRANNDAQLQTAQMTQATTIAQQALEADIEGAKLELEWAKLGQKSGEAQAKLAADVDKIQNDFRLKATELQLKAVDTALKGE